LDVIKILIMYGVKMAADLHHVSRVGSLIATGTNLTMYY
jgi:hypothetical protein